jgi:predicted nucleotidyltransferase
VDKITLESLSNTGYNINVGGGATVRSNTELDNIIVAIKDSAVQLFSHNLKNVILYGSYARGDNDDESDIDVIVLVDMPSDKLSTYTDEISKIASRLSLETERCTTVSIALQDLETYKKYQEFLPHFINISTEGVMIYAA